ncbi:DUF2252 domain-containing protein [Ilumatobacter sp.]|uniref:DUF2252 domain-containing protein n=1 Tax=Ilumatobacter sp. TaxID=1967498 RepID=UPI003C6EDCDB
MRVSPFTFYRGAAAIMAADLSTTPTSGLTVQLGGDAHLSNFGAYASPGRQLVVDANDFDETLRGPWEWDLKRLATSVLIAAQHLGFGFDDCMQVTDRTSRAYAAAMAEYAEMGYLDVWNRLLTVDDLITDTGMTQAKLAKRIERFERRARRKDSRQAVGKLTEIVDGRRQIAHDPPVLFPLRKLPFGYAATEVESAATAALDSYRSTLNDARRFLLDRYSLVDIALKVVGVGSVGTRCFILLLEGRSSDDVFFLQAKEAQASVLEPFLEPSPYRNHGQRIVEGQRMSQAQSDIFLGWTEGRIEHHHYYLRQLRDWKGSVEIEDATPSQLGFYADLCGKTLARAHARTGDPVAISAYIGGGKRLARAVGAFGLLYAAQNLIDFEEFQEAIASNRLAVPNDESTNDPIGRHVRHHARS